MRIGILRRLCTGNDAAIRRRLALSGMVLCVLLGGGKSQPAQARSTADKMAKKYPESRYIVRSASAESPEAAAEAARLEIAKYFEAKISGETVVQEWARSRTARGKSMEERMTEVSNTVVIGASRDIPGIEIAASEGDRSKGRYEAWAVLEKENYARVLGERVSGFDASVDDRLARPGNDLARATALPAVMRDLMSRERARQDLTLLGRETESRNLLLYAVMSSLDSLVAQALDVGIVFEGEVNPRVKSALIKGAVDAGIRVKESSGSGAADDLLVTVSCETGSRKTASTVGGKEYTYFWSDWTLALKAADPSSGKILKTLVLNDKVSGGSAEQAVERMIGRILQNQTPKVTAWMYGIIFEPEKE